MQVFYYSKLPNAAWSNSKAAPGVASGQAPVTPALRLGAPGSTSKRSCLTGVQ